MKTPQHAIRLLVLGPLKKVSGTLSALHFRAVSKRSESSRHLFQLVVMALAAAGLVLNGFPVRPALCGISDALQAPAGCCPQPVAVDSARCGHTCCRAPAQKSESPPFDPARLANHRNFDGSDATADVALSDMSPETRLDRLQFAGAVPISRSPSLVDQHVRLQT